MKKTLILSALIFSGLFYAQNNEFAKYPTNTELLKVKNSVSAKQKIEFYKQYLQNQLVEDMNKTFSYKKYSNHVLRKFADTLMSYVSTQRFNEQDEQQSINNLDQLVALKNKTEEISENLTSLLGSFPVVVKPKDASEHTAFEVIPGEILKIKSWGGGNMIVERYYKISNDILKSISVIPQDESFLNKVSKKLQNKEVTFFSSKGNTYTNVSKDVKNNNYIIGSSLFLVEDSFAPMYEIQYTTKDFENFVPTKVRSNEDKAKWIMIK